MDTKLELTLDKKTNLYSKLYHLKNDLKTWQRISIFDLCRDKYFLNSNIVKALKDLNIIIKQHIQGFKAASTYRWNSIDFPEIDVKLISHIESLSREYSRENSRKNHKNRKIKQYNEKSNISSDYLKKSVDNNINGASSVKQIKFSLMQMLFIGSIQFEKITIFYSDVSFKNVKDLFFKVDKVNEDDLNIVVQSVDNNLNVWTSASIKIKNYKNKTISFNNVDDKFNTDFTIS